MYVPAAFAEHDRATLFDLMERHSFGLLISQHQGEPFASHLPLLIDRRRGENGFLVGHMARANPQWQQADGQVILAVFSGPHAYISPTWYESENVVPTWNYAAVHVYGTFRAIHDEHAVARIVEDTVRLYEASMPTPWTVQTGSEFNRRLIQAIVGFEIVCSFAHVDAYWPIPWRSATESHTRPPDDSASACPLVAQSSW